MQQENSTLNEAMENDQSTLVDKAVAEGGAYEVIRRRLLDQGKDLKSKIEHLNQQRTEEFGSSALEVIGRFRARTENNCVARDIVRVGDCLLFGYNVFIGLKTETQIEDVFALYRLEEQDSGFEATSVPLEKSFLKQTSFKNDFEELYKYYKNTKLIQLVVRDQKLLASFQIGERLDDIRVFRWAIGDSMDDITYIDNRGERDIKLPNPYDFEWLQTSREDSVRGKHPHLNILDTVFVETINGDLTIKIENNTEDGLGIYREPVDDKTQSLDDADIHYAKVGDLILLKITPYRETQTRYFIYNPLTQHVERIDAIADACIQLPEDHGLIYPGGFYLQNGESHSFDESMNGMRFKREIRSPNGEDVLYVFYEPHEGKVALFAYNLIDKSLQNPIFGHGYGILDDGRMVIFTAEEAEATRIHPMQMWQTPFCSDEFSSNIPVTNSFWSKIGNVDLVRGISDLYSVYREINTQTISTRHYNQLCQSVRRLFNAYHWLTDPHTQNIHVLLKEIADTSELVLDEFEKVESIRLQSEQALQEAKVEQDALMSHMTPSSWDSTDQFVDTLNKLRHQRGHLLTIRDYRYMDVAQIDEMEQALKDADSKVSLATAEFLTTDKALDPFHHRMMELEVELTHADTRAKLDIPLEGLEQLSSDLDLLSGLMTSLEVSDATQRTQIIDSISEIYAKLNQVKAQGQHKRKDLGSAEAVMQFSAQFKLFNQSITNALAQASTPEKCDEQLSRLTIQLEELESQFSEHDEFLADIIAKRDEVYENFESHKQALLDARQRKAQNIQDAASRILTSIQRRVSKILTMDDINTFYASDALVMKVKAFVEQLRKLQDPVKADDIEARFKNDKEQAIRAIRDKADIFEEGGNVIKLGPRHKFSVNTQELDLTLLPRNDMLYTHLTGTDYFAPIEEQILNELSDYWDVSLESESPNIYRAEYLAGSILEAAEQHQGELALDRLMLETANIDQLTKTVREYAAPKYKEGYQKGIHDYDAALILQKLLPARQSAELLRFNPESRAIAMLFWASEQKQSEITAYSWPVRAQSALKMQTLFKRSDALILIQQEIHHNIKAFIESHQLPISSSNLQQASIYLSLVLAQDNIAFPVSKYGRQLSQQLKTCLKDAFSWQAFEDSLSELKGQPGARWKMTQSWLLALLDSDTSLSHLQHYLAEALALTNLDNRIPLQDSEADLNLQIDGLMGAHSRIKNQSLMISLDDFSARFEEHRSEFIPKYHQYLEVRQNVADSEKKNLRLHEFKARPLSSFVRNKLINESYLPIIGDNLAKQMGTIGDNKRTDLMGLLMMISPPGYGKTTLMEYVANRLGLIFMKINCPSLGHDVMSLDPEQAPNATARQELEKLNLALEMGNNVMLYLDDIQHTHPEFLQKFISLCDGTRRIEGIWKKQTKTYDMRGKKFCVVMAGNPYTESGEVFKIPDMLANRADIYNLGDVLGGMQEAFDLSYIENSLTSNPVLAPLATRDLSDLYIFVDMARGNDVSTNELKHNYSGAEINEIVDVLKKMLMVRDVVLKVNQQYIASAAQADRYRTEPPFKLQGSYRNMNKMAEKISAVMNEQEILNMIADHYQGESQLLTSGAEENLLKLAELRGNMTDEQQARWNTIKADFKRSQSMGGDDADVGSKVVMQLVDMVEGIQSVGKQIETAHTKQVKDAALSDNPKEKESEKQQLINQHKQLQLLHQIVASINNVSKSFNIPAPKVEVNNQPVPEVAQVLQALANTLENSIYPLVRSMDKKIEIDLGTHNKMGQVLSELKQLEKSIAGKGGVAKKTTVAQDLPTSKHPSDQAEHEPS